MKKNRIPIIRITQTKPDEIQIRIPLKNYFQVIKNFQEIHDELLHLLRLFGGIDEAKDNLGPELWKNIFSAIKEIRQALFAQQHFFSISKIIQEAAQVKILVDRGLEWFLFLPWEILNCSSDVSQPYWGEHTLFHRTGLSMDTGTGPGRQFRKIDTYKWVGMLSYEHIPDIEIVKDYLAELGENERLSYETYPMNGEYGVRLIEKIRLYLQKLNIIHISCLLIKLRFGNQSKLVLSDKVFISPEDIERKLFLREKMPIVVLDILENEPRKILFEERYLFIKSFIKIGANAVLTNIFPLPRNFTNRFFKFFYAKLSNRNHFQAFQETQRELLDKNEPLALMMWIYGNPSLPVEPGISSDSIISSIRTRYAMDPEKIPDR